MADIVLPVVGGVAGFLIGGPTGAALGANIGAFAGNVLFPKHTHVPLPTQEGPRLADLRVQTSLYGNNIPQVFGTMRLGGNIIWARDIKEVRRETTSTSGGGKGGGGSSASQTSVTYEYYVTLAIAICEGEIEELTRAWADSKVLTEEVLASGRGKYNIHRGTETQPVDDIMARYLPAGTIPAYRGLAYVVIEDFPLADYGNRIPNFTFEVKRKVKFKSTVEEKIKDIVMIPGAGEFVYGRDVTTKQDGHYVNRFFPTAHKQFINMHNYSAKADMLLSLDQLQESLPNLEWVAVVVTWFATSTDAGACEITPKVEFHGTTRVRPQNWRVAGMSRSSAPLVLFFEENRPTYGGTPSDHTVIEICEELRRRGLKVMLYPMIFVDQIAPEPKPWRGRIRPRNAYHCARWFTKTKGYNRFITHYANLVRGKVDAFVIGSELVGMTGFSSSTGVYPAVTQFVNLAASIKNIMGQGTKITYAADWSEYHSTGGWFNLDPLWASPNIDMVGIDSYFPLTPDLPQHQITEDEIKTYWEKGEGWDYYYQDSHRRTGKTSYDGQKAYAWKNLEYWWKNTHRNPNGQTTAWRSKMKPVWFTEFGFPSVDGAANQPNLFYDPSSSESHFPRGSQGRIDFQAQREAINASLDYLETRRRKRANGQLVPRRFLWTWDARPFPFWPDLAEIWQDGSLWATGHWVQGKFGNAALGAIVGELFQKAGLTPSDYDITRLTETVEGFVLTQPISVRDAISQLAAAFFFDVVESNGILKCVPRGGQNVRTIEQDDLVPLEKSGVQDVLEINYTQEMELPQRVNITHIDRHFNYDPGTQSSQRQVVKSLDQVSINLPIVMSGAQAKRVADITLYSTWRARVGFSFMLPPRYARLEPSDIITLIVDGTGHQMRITKIDMEHNGLMRVVAVAENVSNYDFYTPPDQTIGLLKPPATAPKTLLELVDAPPLPTDVSQRAVLRIASAPDGADWKGAALYRSDDGGEQGGNDFRLFSGVDSASVFGAIISDLGAGSFETWDRFNSVDVALINGQLESVSELALLNGANAALIGDELVQFQTAQLIGDNLYRLSMLLRGRQGTEWAIGSQHEGDRFILLAGLHALEVANNLIGRELHYKAVSVGSSLAATEETAFTYRGRNLKPFAPVHLRGQRDRDGNLTISWIRRARIDAEWRDGVDVALSEESEHYHVEIIDGVDVVRLIETDAPMAVYNAANQTQDFGSRQNSVAVKVYQLSAIVGRGYAATASF